MNISSYENAITARLSYLKSYRENNRELLREKARQYHNENKEQRSEYKRNRKQQHPELYKEIMTCECGHSFQRQQKNRHIKTQKHINSLSQKTTS